MQGCEIDVLLPVRVIKGPPDPTSWVPRERPACTWLTGKVGRNAACPWENHPRRTGGALGEGGGVCVRGWLVGEGMERSR